MPSHIDPRVSGMEPSATVAINEKSDALRRSGKNVVKLGLGQSPFPVPEPLVDALRLYAREKEYLPVKGLPALREAVAAYHRRRTGVAYGVDTVIIGPGSKELMFILQLVFDGELLLPTPAWVSYVPQARIAGRRVRSIATSRETGWSVLPGQLEEVCREDSGRPRLLILNYPNNPTGTSYRASELEELAQVARRHGVIVLSDEIYGELHYRGAHSSIASFYPEGTIISGGLSKWCGAGGWRLGTFALPSELAWLSDAMAAVASETYTTTSAPTQYAAIAAFRGGPAIERYLSRARRLLEVLARSIVARLSKIATVVPPAGAFYVFPDFEAQAPYLAARGISDSETLARRLLEETGVATLPGTCFGRDARELTLRLAFVDFDGARAMNAMENDAAMDAALLAAHCGPMLQGIETMCDWIGSHG
jgi:aspartate aminotransferase